MHIIHIRTAKQHKSMLISQNNVTQITLKVKWMLKVLFQDALRTVHLLYPWSLGHWACL